MPFETLEALIVSTLSQPYHNPLCLYTVVKRMVEKIEVIVLTQTREFQYHLDRMHTVQWQQSPSKRGMAKVAVPVDGGLDRVTIR